MADNDGAIIYKARLTHKGGKIYSGVQITRVGIVVREGNVITVTDLRTGQQATIIDSTAETVTDTPLLEDNHVK